MKLENNTTWGRGQSRRDNCAWKDVMIARYPGSHCGPYGTQPWFMGETEEKPWDRKEVRRDNRVPPYPAACSGTFRELATSDSEKKEWR